MEQRFNITTLKSLHSTVEALSGQYPRGVFYLSGDLGTGKSTFVRTWLSHLGFTGAVPSPTYALLNTYDIDGKSIFHADLYRLSDPEELFFLDVREWQADLIFIEWPQMGANVLPAADLFCQFELCDGTRFLSVHSSKNI